MTIATIAPPAMQEPECDWKPKVLVPQPPASLYNVGRSPSSSRTSRNHGKPQSLYSMGDNANRRSHESVANTGPSERRKMFRIQNYVIYRKTIGAGSMGKVKLAECLTDSSKQQYAVKIVPKVNLAAMANVKVKDPKDSPKEREQRTVREMAMMHLLRHPHICQLKEWITEGNYHYMFIEYVDGGQLLDYIISHGKLREKQARKFARQIISALDYCHKNSIVHRDLKIENILLTKNEEIKIIDFGLSNTYSPSRLLSTFCGSLYFAAPELLQARHYTGPEVDLWSFGVVLYVLVCGRVPFDDTSLPALHAKIKSGQVDGYPEHLSKDCVDLLSNIFVVDPKKRYTLSQVQSHPWITKGYDIPINNYLPHRQQLREIDMTIVEGMSGFGFGDPHDIYNKLQSMIACTEYREAVSQVDQNYHTRLLLQEQGNRPRWRRSLTRKRTSQIMDDPQTLPAMYDPLISIYYLAKEKKEYDERAKMASCATQPTTSLRRASSTSTIRNHSHGAQTGLLRRKTDRIPSTPKVVHADTNASFDGTNTELLLANEDSVSKMILSRSKSAVRRLHAMLPNISTPRQSQDGQEKSLPPLPISTDDSDGASKTSSTNPTTDTLRQSTKPGPSKEINRKPSSSWRHISISRSSSKFTRGSIELSSPTEHVSPMSMSVSTNQIHPDSDSAEYRADSYSKSTSASDECPSPSMGAHPKSLFNFNRRHLFRGKPGQLMADLEHVLSAMHVRHQISATDPFTLHCECDFPEWTAFLQKPVMVQSTLRDSTLSSNIDDRSVNQTDQDTFIANSNETLKFTVLIYQARWAGGRLGIKVKEAEDDASALNTTIYRNLYHTILFELGKYVAIHASA